jgi:hypothetical protein
MKIMCDLTYIQILEIKFNKNKEKLISMGKYFEKESIDYNKNFYSDIQINFIEFGRFCEHHNLNSNDLDVYDRFLECDMKDWNVDNIEYNSLGENQIYVFFNRLKTNVYKVILVNEMTPITNNERCIDLWLDEMLSDIKSVEVGYDTIKIIKLDNTEIFLEGLEEISDGEIILRDFLDKSDFSGNIIIKNSLKQIEIREKNIISIDKDLYYKCKDVVNIRKIPEDSEDYNMNWDCLLVKFKDSDEEEIWQPC